MKPSDQEIEEQASRKMANWVACIADQVRNPIASVSSALNVVERELAGYRGSGKLNEHHCRIALEKAQHRLERLNVYVTELINFAKPLTPRPERQNLKQAVARVVADMSLSLPVKSNVEVAVTKELSIDCDEHCLQTILSALLLNACEAVPADRSPVVRLSANYCPKRIGVEVIIEDNGPGFNGSGPAILQPFNSSKEAGTGMGLAVVNKYMMAHGGTVSLTHSRELGGAKVCLFFPAQPNLTKQ